MVDLHWSKCRSGSWCLFEKVNLNHSHFSGLEGVYIIWNAQEIIYIGQGIIKDRITAHRYDKEIKKYRNVMVTWAKVDSDKRDGIEKYLAESLQPAVGESSPDASPIQVNLPGFR